MTYQSSRTLPPLVDGNVYGHLTVTIDEVLWCRKHPVDVTVLLQWWGENDSVSLRPADISKYPESAKETTSITYNIQTSLSLFQAYLKQISKLKLLLISNTTKEIVGHVEINHLNELIIGLQYQKYFPILTSSGTSIGDLRVDFNLSMNAISEETSSKKMKKRSRRKNKSNHTSFRPANDEDKSKQIKNGCKTCSEHIKPTKKVASAEHALNLDLPKQPVTSKAPPNTERSDSSDCVLLEVLEKGKQLRDAMVLSVLEDTDANPEEELLLKIDQVGKESKLSYKPLKRQKNGDFVTPSEEKLINDYLGGKTMNEEEEILVLNTLHATNKECNFGLNRTNDHSENQEPCPSSKPSCPQSASSDKTQPATTIISSTVTQVSSFIEGENSLLKKINCFRLTIDNLTLTNAGWKKVNQAAENKNKSCDTVPPPGATYFVECHFVEDSPRSQAQQWKATPLRFCSRRQIEHVVYFGQSSAHSLRPPHSIASIQNELAAVTCLVCWRHLNQRVPALLGHFSLDSVMRQPCVETTVTLPVISEADSVVAHVKLKLELGKDKLYFGQALYGETQNPFRESNNPIKVIEEERVVQIKEYPLDVKDLIGRNNPQQVDKDSVKKEQGKPGSKVISQNQTQLPDFIDIPVCANCSQNLLLANSLDSSLCIGCTNLLNQHQGHFIDTNFKIDISGDAATKEQRYHEYLLGIDSVIRFPLFTSIQEELSCYIDYKFPEITSGFKAELAKSETTSRVVACEPQPQFSSVHRHTLTLPVVLPLSPLLASCSPGITLRLWLRYYKPTPRDHMVAMALLPMDELCLMELEFDQKEQKSSVTRVLELPLALVPSSVTAPYQQCNSVGAIRVSVTYSNYISAAASSKLYRPVPTAEPPSHHSESSKQSNEPVKEEVPYKKCKNTGDSRNIHTLPSSKYIDSEPKTPFEHNERLKRDKAPVEAPAKNEEELRAAKNRFWTGPFGGEYGKLFDQENVKESPKQKTEPEKTNVFPQTNLASTDLLDKIFGVNSNQSCGVPKENSCPVMKEDFDLLAESLEQRFNKLQSDLMKERQRGLSEIDRIVVGDKKPTNLMNDGANDDFLSFHSLSSNSSMESLPFILGPPANFKDMQNTVIFSEAIKPFSDSQSDRSASDTISSFIKEGKNEANFGSNDSFDRTQQKPETVKPKTFKAKIKVDRAVNLKAVKMPSNGKKSKVPPSSWVSFGTGDCCEQNCGSGGLVCSGQRFTTPVIRRNYNPIWNLAWDVDLPVEYLQQVNKRLVFRIFEENLEVAFGFASANLSILTSGLPCLSSWLSINDLAGACKGQIKIVVTPLEDVSKYQECSVFDNEEEDFEESKEKKQESNASPNKDKSSTVMFVASQTEVFVNEGSCEGASSSDVDREVEQLLKWPENEEDAIEREDPVSADDVISDYKNTLENNFRNEMAGLENLIKFLRVGSMSNELSFLRATENKENLSSNPTSQNPTAETRMVSSPDGGVKFASNKSGSVSDISVPQNRILIDASTETSHREEMPSNSNQNSSEDILSKLLQQISMFQLPTVKIADNTCQTVVPETKETFTETSVDNQTKLSESVTVHMRDASTETEDIIDNRPQSGDDNLTSQPPHVCGELGSVLLQHFLTCRPTAVKVVDSACQTVSLDKASTADSSGVFVRSQPSGMSTEIFNNFPSGSGIPDITTDWVSSDQVQSNSERLIAIDNNIRDLERFLKENLIMPDRESIPPVDSKEGSVCESLNGIMDSVQVSVKKSSGSSTDLESLGSYSQDILVPRETPDGGNFSTVPDTQSTSNPDNTSTTMKRRGTFVIDKSKDRADESGVNREPANLA